MLHCVKCVFLLSRVEEDLAGVVVLVVAVETWRVGWFLSWALLRHFLS